MTTRLLTFLIATLPIIEIRGAIPFGILSGLSPEEAFFWGTLGNIAPNFLILKFFGPVSSFLMKNSKYCDRFFTKLFEITRKKHSKKFEKIGAVFLVTFIAIPIPGTGSWTGSMIAWLYKIPYWKAMGLISLGVIGAGILVSLGVTSVIKVIEIFF